MTSTLAADPAAGITDGQMDERVLVVDIALGEFARRNAVPASDIVEAIAIVSPDTANILDRVTSRYENEPGILHYRDAINPLLDLRQELCETSQPTPV